LAQRETGALSFIGWFYFGGRLLWLGARFAGGNIADAWRGGGYNFVGGQDTEK